MAKFQSLYTIFEEVYDDTGNVVALHEKNLPHSSEIIKLVCDKWNKAADQYMLGLVNEHCDQRIKSCYMRQYNKMSDVTTLCVDFVAKEGKQLTGKIREAICEFMSAQWSDGFGESIFYRKYTASDGTVFGLN